VYLGGKSKGYVLADNPCGFPDDSGNGSYGYPASEGFQHNIRKRQRVT
jgi:hypothetical protein